MKYQSTSFFTKYGLDPDIELGKLRVLFQTDPTKRKDLPIVNKTISTPQLLFEEELFTPHTEVDFFLTTHARLLQEVQDIHEKIEVSTLDNLRKDLIILSNSESEWDHFFYADAVPNYKNITRDFFICIYDEIAHILVNTIGDINSSFTEALFDALNDVSESVDWLSEKPEELIEGLCEFADNSLSIGDVSSSFGNKFASLLKLAEKIDHNYFKSSLRYVIEKMLDELDIYGNVLLSHYDLIATAFNGDDLLKISSFITKIGNKYCDITGTSLDVTPEEAVDGCSKIAKAINSLKNSGTTLKNIENGRNQIDLDELNICFEIASFISNNSVKWYEKYRILLNSIEDVCDMKSMYSLVSHVIKAKPTAEVLNIISNVIIEKSDFEDFFEFILTGHSEFINKRTTKYLDPNDIDDFIGKYYWLIYALKDTSVFNENAINNIRMFSLDELSSADSAMERLNIAKAKRDNNEIMQAALIANLAVNKALSAIPKDFFVDENLRAVDAVKNNGGTHSGNVSKSSEYIDKYCDLFGMPRTKYGREAYNNWIATPTPVKTVPASTTSSSKSNNSIWGTIISIIVFIIIGILTSQ